jgi:hypothetical protein
MTGSQVPSRAKRKSRRAARADGRGGDRSCTGGPWRGTRDVRPGRRPAACVRGDRSRRRPGHPAGRRARRRMADIHGLPGVVAPDWPGGTTTGPRPRPGRSGSRPTTAILDHPRIASPLSGTPCIETADASDVLADPARIEASRTPAMTGPEHARAIVEEGEIRPFSGAPTSPSPASPRTSRPATTAERRGRTSAPRPGTGPRRRGRSQPEGPGSRAGAGHAAHSARTERRSAWVGVDRGRHLARDGEQGFKVAAPPPRALAVL